MCFIDWVFIIFFYWCVSDVSVFNVFTSHCLLFKGLITYLHWRITVHSLEDSAHLWHRWASDVKHDNAERVSLGTSSFGQSCVRLRLCRASGPSGGGQLPWNFKARQLRANIDWRDDVITVHQPDKTTLARPWWWAIKMKNRLSIDVVFISYTCASLTPGENNVCRSFVWLLFWTISVGDGGCRGARAPPQKNREKVFFAQIPRKIRVFSGKNHITLGNFVNFSGIYQIKYGNFDNFYT